MGQLLSFIATLIIVGAFLIAGSLHIYWNEETPPAFHVALNFQWPEHSRTFSQRVLEGEEPGRLASLWDAALISFGERVDKPSLADQVRQAISGTQAPPPEYRITPTSIGRRLSELIVAGPYYYAADFHSAQPFQLRAIPARGAAAENTNAGPLIEAPAR